MSTPDRRPCARCAQPLDGPDPEYCLACVRTLAARAVVTGDRDLQARFVRPEWVRRAQAGSLPAKDLTRMA